MEFTPTQQRILDLLRDGERHLREEILEVIGNGTIDEVGTKLNLRQHIFHMNKKLRPIGQEVVCIIGKSYSIGYRHVRLLVSANDGKR